MAPKVKNPAQYCIKKTDFKAIRTPLSEAVGILTDLKLIYRFMCNFNFCIPWQLAKLYLKSEETFRQCFQVLDTIPPGVLTNRIAEGLHKKFKLRA